MIRFIVRRLVLSIPVLFGIVLLTFTLARVLPGDPCRAALGERATDEICDAYNERVGLERVVPHPVRIYTADALQGDLGESITQRRPVTDLLVERLPTTIELALAALAHRRGRRRAPRHPLRLPAQQPHVDVGTMVGANVGVSMPVFWLGLMLQYLFAVMLRDTAVRPPALGPARRRDHPHALLREVGAEPRTACSSSSPT